MGSSFLQKDDAGKPCNLGITDNLSLQARAREEEPLGFAPCPWGRESSPPLRGVGSFISLFSASKMKPFPFCSYFLCWFSLESGLVLTLVPGACLPGKLQRGKVSLERFQA